MGELVATMAIRPLVSMLMNKASSYLLDQYKVMEGVEAQRRVLKRKLLAILDVITDAEEQAMAQREGAKAWLQELKTVSSQANEVFDEFKYEALRREAMKNGHYSKPDFDVIKLFPSQNRAVFRHRMNRKLGQILQAIEVLIADMQAFGFKNQPHAVSKEWRRTDYVIIDPREIASRSRDKDKRKIVDILLRQANNADLAVVPIVGMGGLGKTTLAQLIYNEPEIQKHFQLLLWVCVSDTFDVNSLAKSIIEASPKKNDDTHEPPLDILQKLVRGQRYLLVLDDVWKNREFHEWERVKVCLQSGGMGSAVLATTRDKQVAEIMGADRAYSLSYLEDRFLKEIIETKAFGLEKERPDELVKMVNEIVKRCSGSPLAATALGSILRTKTSMEEWKVVSSRSSICTDETGILPILKLSYNDLPSHMKQCFALCAVFPKDYKIDVEKLIRLWIANGFIPEHEEGSLETIGKHIFDELASRSFFLDIEESKESWEYYPRTTCKIHDLMHDIAMFVMGKECVVVTMEPSEVDWLPDTARHLFLSCDILNDSMEKRSPGIQTLLCDKYVGSSLQYLSKYRSLQTLKLCMRESFLFEPKYLHHLRYLDLSGSLISSLPEDLTILYNLQALDLSCCCNLYCLPKKMKYMTSLCHLYTHGCPELKSMPSELGKLTKLQTLTCFVAAVSVPFYSDVAELRYLDLGGQLELRQVENVKEAEAKVAYLGNKKDLRELTLSWSYVCDSKVLDNFEPHDGLQVLKIYSYGGKCMGMFRNMVEIHLFHCERLQFLFRCGTSLTFPKLKVLTLEDLLDLERWWEINERQEEQIIFPVLEKLFIRHCRMLVALPEAQQLFIGKCGKLMALPEARLLQEPCIADYRLVRSPFPALKVLELEGLERFQKWDAVEEQILFPRLEKLSIQACPKLIDLPEAPLLEEPCSGGGYRLVRSAFPALKVLKMKYLESFQRLSAVEGTSFPQLEELLVLFCPELLDLPETPKLSVLQIENGKQELFHFVHRYLSSMTKLILRLENTETSSKVEHTIIVPVDNKEKWNQKSHLKFLGLGCCNSFFGSGALEPWVYFVHLEELQIERCDVLVHWPEKVFQTLVSLRILRILNCKNLTGYAQAPLETAATERSQHRPGLESLEIKYCASLVEMFNVPTSLKKMNVTQCDKLKSIFGKQQGMSELAGGSSCSEAIVPTALSESLTNHFCPCLEYLDLHGCGSLPAVLNLPPSLKTIYIGSNSSIQVLTCQMGELQKPEVTTSINVPEPSAAVAAAREHSLPPCLESLEIWCCDGMLGGILRLPTSLKALRIYKNNGFTSLESLAREQPPSFESLRLTSCSTLASLPNDPRAYGSLYRLEIKECPAIKKLPRCLQQQLGSINSKKLDAQYEVTEFKPFKPKTWKEIPRIVRERRQASRS